MTIEAKGASGADVYTTFVVIAHISISPNQGPSGTTIKVNGSYFTPNGQVLIYWFEPVSHTTTYLTGTSASATGSFQITITAPAGLTAGIHYRVLANDVSGQGCLAYFIAQA